MGLIIVTIDKIGRPTIEGEGFIGTECDEKMRPIEEALGGKGIREDHPEYHMIEEETEAQQTINN